MFERKPGTQAVQLREKLSLPASQAARAATDINPREAGKCHMKEDMARKGISLEPLEGARQHGGRAHTADAHTALRGAQPFWSLGFRPREP